MKGLVEDSFPHNSSQSMKLAQMLKIVHDSKPKFQDPFDKSVLISEKESHGPFLNLSFLSFFLIWNRFLGWEEETESVVGCC